MNRFRAFGVHLSGSILIGLCAAALVFLVWYPAPLPAATGVAGIFLLLLTVDVVTGPCITFIVFNPAKKELKRDLTIVVLLQLSALCYGLYTVSVARPVYYIFNVDRFDLVFANDLSPEKLAKVGDARFQSIPLFGPQFAAAVEPTDLKERNDVLFNAADGGDDFAQVPKYYVPYADRKAQVLAHLKPLDGLRTFNPAREADVTVLVSKHAGAGYLPIRGKTADLTAIVSRGSAEVLEIVELKPWQ